MENKTIETIYQFVNNWKENAKDYYLTLQKEYLENKKTADLKSLQNELIEKVGKVMFNEIAYQGIYLEERLEKLLTKQAIKKTNDLLSTINTKGGNILDINTLTIDSKSGSLNGIIKCENGLVKVETIYAGGYNIQKLHFRTLVQLIK